MAAYLGYTLQMKTLFRGWPVIVHDTHTRRRRMLTEEMCSKQMCWQMWKRLYQCTRNLSVLCTVHKPPLSHFQACSVQPCNVQYVYDADQLFNQEVSFQFTDRSLRPCLIFWLIHRSLNYVLSVWQVYIPGRKDIHTILSRKTYTVCLKKISPVRALTVDF